MNRLYQLERDAKAFQEDAEKLAALLPRKGLVTVDVDVIRKLTDMVMRATRALVDNAQGQALLLDHIQGITEQREPS